MWARAALAAVLSLLFGDVVLGAQAKPQGVSFGGLVCGYSDKPTFLHHLIASNGTVPLRVYDLSANPQPRAMLGDKGLSIYSISFNGRLGRLLSGEGANASSFSSIRHFSEHVMGRLKRTPHIPDASPGNQQQQARYYDTVPGPISHVALGFKIVFGSLVFVAGFYYLLNAFRLSGQITEVTGLLYLLLGILGMLSGTLVGLNGIEGMSR